jgi:hypothetical protein
MAWSHTHLVIGLVVGFALFWLILIIYGGFLVLKNRTISQVFTEGRFMKFILCVSLLQSCILAYSHLLLDGLISYVFP